jgi:hypothetical protein
MLHRLYLASNDASHDKVTCTRCRDVYPHLAGYQCNGCEMLFHCERIGDKHVCRRPTKKQRRARVPRRRSCETATEYVASEEPYTKSARLELREAATEYVASVGQEPYELREAATEYVASVGQEPYETREAATEYVASVGQEPYAKPARLELREAATEYVASLDHELHAMVGNVYRLRETSRNGLRGPLLGFVVNALSPMQIKLEVLTMTAGKVGLRGLRQGIHKDGRCMITRPIQDLRAVIATDCVDVAAALFFDLTVRQSVWRGFRAFYAHSPVLLRPTLESLATLQSKDRNGIKWVEANAKASLHPDRVVRYVQFLYNEGYVTKEQVDILTRFVTDAFVRVCSTLK